MNLYTMLKQREEQGNPIKVGLIGAGKFGAMFLSQARRTPGLQIVGIADLSHERAKDALIRTGWSQDAMAMAATSSSINDIAKSNKVALTEDAYALIETDLDVIVECTGIVEAGAKHASAAIDAERHVVMVNVETDSCIGPLLHQKAQQKGVVYSMAFGDQPALVCQMVDWARTCGFEIVAAGKGTKYLPSYHYSTPETVWGLYGFSEQQVTEGDFNPKMFNSFLDGTKSAIEMAAIANATGLIPQEEGLHFPPVGTDQLASQLIPQEFGGTLTRSGTVEVISSLNRDGTEVENDLRWGVYISFKANSAYVKDCFAQYGVVTDKSGEYAALYRPSHLIGLELGVSVASVALRNEPTGMSNKFVGDVAATAKKDLQTGDMLDGEGGHTVFGRLVDAKVSLQQSLLPLGLASQVTVKNPVKKDQLISYADVEFKQDELAWELRKKMEAKYQAVS